MTEFLYFFNTYWITVQYLFITVRNWNSHRQQQDKRAQWWWERQLWSISSWVCLCVCVCRRNFTRHCISCSHTTPACIIWTVSHWRSKTERSTRKITFILHLHNHVTGNSPSWEAESCQLLKKYPARMFIRALTTDTTLLICPVKNKIYPQSHSKFI